MIITRIIGGLGNQMFQYATGRRLSLVLGSNLKLDISYYKNNKLRNYCLDFFNIKSQITDEKETHFSTSHQKGLLSQLKRQKLKPSALKHIPEKHFHFDPTVLTLPDDVYLDGYWQSEKYFSDIKDIIHQDFMLKNPPKDNNLKLLHKIESTNSVCIHIRRGDYVTNPTTYQNHGLCSLDYYKKGIQHIIRKIEKPIFYVFSDDISWTKDNLKINHPIIFVDHNNGERMYEDMRLMTNCKHHIIANSSFSWWGAWLCQNPVKTVIAPRQWFNADTYDTKDLIPQGWKTI